MSVFRYPHPDKHLGNRIKSACIKAGRRGVSEVDVARQLLNAAVWRLHCSCSERDTVALLKNAIRKLQNIERSALLADAELLEQLIWDAEESDPT